MTEDPRRRYPTPPFPGGQQQAAPGPVWTPIQPIVKSAEELEALGTDTPLGRAGQPAELAGAYVLLASHEGSYMTGALIPVTGGAAML